MLRLSLRTKFLIPLLIGGFALALAGSWYTYQATLEDFREQLLHRGHLLAHAIDEAARLVDDTSRIGFSVEHIVRHQPGVYGIAVATTEPFVIWAASFKTGPKDQHAVAGQMLKQLRKAFEREEFRYEFQESGDLSIVYPLSRGASIEHGTPLGMQHAPHNESMHDHPPIQSVYEPTAMNAEHRGAIYLHFDWASIREEAQMVLIQEMLIILAGISLLILLAYWLLHRTVLRPMNWIGETIRQQDLGDESARVRLFGRDEMGHLAATLNKMLDSLVERDRNFRAVVNHLPIAVSLRDTKGDRQLSNDQFDTWFGPLASKPTHTEPAGKTYRNGTGRSPQEEQPVPTQQSITLEEARVGPNGITRFFMTTKFPVFDIRGALTAIGTASTDITEKIQTEKALFAEKERAQVTLKSIGEAVISTDANGRIDFLNPIAEALTGWPVDEAKGRYLAEVFHVIHEETQTPAEDPVTRCLQEGKIVSLANHMVLVSRSQRESAVEYSAGPIFSEKGEVLGVVLVFKDVTKARQLSQQISYQAAHDALTGLINRFEFERRLQSVVERVRADSAEHALCYLDLDQFKLVNDTCGHVAGDELLRQLGQLLKSHLRKRDTLARLGGDEFGLLMEHCSIKEATRVTENLIRIVGDFSFSWEGRSFHIGVSIGLVAVDHKSVSVSGILSAADSACYLAKEQGRNRVHVHQDDDEDLARRHGEMQWAVRLPRALEEDRFRLYAQEIVPVDGNDTDQPSHYELLLRMENEIGELVMPSAFLPAAERYNLSDKLDRWVIHRAFRWLQEHPKHVDRLDTCSINISGLSLGSKNFLSFVVQEFEATGIPTGKICFEITETVAIANLSSATALINALKGLGCRFALDDFGSGLSSFGYLKNLPVDYLKIDGLFVKDILDDPMDLAMVTSINDIGHVMGKRTIAEFVENDAVLAKLKEVGVDYAQGYGIGRPRPIEEKLDLARTLLRQSG